MKKETIQQYEILVSFLGKVLGPSYEIVLHEINNNEVRMLSIVNGGISNRIVENTISERTLNIIKEKRYSENYTANDIVRLKNSKKLRSSSMFIKENEKIVGMLCINFDDTRFSSITIDLLRNIHPDIFLDHFLSDIQHNIFYEKAKNDFESEEKIETMDNIDNIETLMENIYTEIVKKLQFPMDRLKKSEKEKIVEKLYDKDFFKLKESIPFVAKKLNCSLSTMYRYVKKFDK